MDVLDDIDVLPVFVDVADDMDMLPVFVVW
jgi:hypothetical protein